MKKLLSAVVIAGALAAALVLRPSSAQEGGAAREPRGHAEWVLESLKEMEAVKVGMTRADLMKVFNEEGGVSSRRQRTYSYRGCAYFKVDVTFEPVGSAEDRLGGVADDKIVAISRPYLARIVAD